MQNNFHPSDIATLEGLFQKYSRIKVMYNDVIVDPVYGEVRTVPGKIRSGDLVYNTDLKKVGMVYKCDLVCVTLSSGNVWMKELVMKVTKNI